jgi:hypothetical protein
LVVVYSAIFLSRSANGCHVWSKLFGGNVACSFGLVLFFL